MLQELVPVDGVLDVIDRAMVTCGTDERVAVSCVQCISAVTTDAKVPHLSCARAHQVATFVW